MSNFGTRGLPALWRRQERNSSNPRLDSRSEQIVMTFLSDIYALPTNVPFLDVDVDNDNLLFADGSAIRNAADPYGVRAQAELTGFFTGLIQLRQSPSLTDRTRGLSILQRMSEPGETRLGYSAKGTNGKGFGNGLGRVLWAALGNRLCQEQALTRIEHLPLFLDGVDRDLMSDMITRVAMDILVDFTHDMMRQYPALAATTTTQNLMVWDPQKFDWVSKSCQLPFVGGKQLVLIPRSWVTWQPLMHPNPFYNRYTTQAVQDEQTSITPDGKIEKPYKWQIKADHPKIKQFNSERTLQDMSVSNHVQEYQREVDQAYVPLDADVARSRILKGLPKAS